MSIFVLVRTLALVLVLETIAVEYEYEEEYEEEYEATNDKSPPGLYSWGAVAKTASVLICVARTLPRS